MPTSPILGVPLPGPDEPDGAAYLHLKTAVEYLEQFDGPRFADAAARDAVLPDPVRGQEVWIDSPGAVQRYTGTEWRTIAPLGITASDDTWGMSPYAGLNNYNLASEAVSRDEPYCVLVIVQAICAVSGTSTGKLRITQTGAAGNSIRAGDSLTAGKPSAICVDVIPMPDGGELTVFANLEVDTDSSITVYADYHSHLRTLVLPYGAVL